MPQKDKSDTNRDRKKGKRGNCKDGVYSSKHVRILEGRQLLCNSEKQNKKSIKIK